MLNRALDIQFQHWLRKNHGSLSLTVVPDSNVPLLPFAYSGNARADLDTSNDAVVRWRGYVPPSRNGSPGGLGDVDFFAKYHYIWANEDFILYAIQIGPAKIQYMLKEPDTTKGETTMSHNTKVDNLFLTVGEWAAGDVNKYVYVYDGYWQKSEALWEQVQNSHWKDVILDPTQKKALKSVSNTFFDSKDIYKRYGVPWKRGLIFYGPPGNGKTVSIKALMHGLYEREHPIVTLYVKSAPYTYNIRDVFSFARSYSPCMLVMEDIETIVTNDTRSYFFNEVDGLENNDGIFMVASTNYIDRLDPGLSQRPSRFDRKYLFPIPTLEERTAYAAYWRGKLSKSSPDIAFPEKLCKPFAEITDKFSFAYLQEAFVAALLGLARGEAEMRMGKLEREQGDEYFDPPQNDDLIAVENSLSKATLSGGDHLEDYKLWRALKKSVDSLRQDLGNGDDAARSASLPMREPGSTYPRGPERLISDCQRRAGLMSDSGSQRGPASASGSIPQYPPPKETSRIMKPFPPQASAYSQQSLDKIERFYDRLSQSQAPFGRGTPNHKATAQALNKTSKHNDQAYQGYNDAQGRESQSDSLQRGASLERGLSSSRGMPEAQVKASGVYKTKVFTETAFETQ